MNDIKEQLLVEIVNAYRFQSSRLRTLEHLFNEAEQTGSAPSELENITLPIQEAAKEQLPLLDTYVRALAKGHESCLADKTPSLDSCKLPEKPSMTGVDLLYRLINL
jgi:hypothetical protein